VKHRETIAAPRADAMLLRMHYLRVVVPLLAVSLGTLLALMIGIAVATRFQAGNWAEGLDVAAVVLGLLLALPAGGAVFSRQFKEQQVLLFHTLPVPRLRQWAIFVSSSALALATAWAALAIVRPAALSLLTREKVLGPFLVVSAISFAAGLCCSLVFVRPVAVYMAAYVVAMGVPQLIGLSLFAPYLAYERPLSRFRPNQLVDELPRLPPWIWWFAATALVAVLTTASAVFYIRGEITHARVQTRNALIVLGCVILLIACAAPLTWVTGQRGGRIGEPKWSPDQRSVAVWRTNERAPWRSDITVHDLAAGTSASWRADGTIALAWTDRGELLTVTRDVSPLARLLYLRPQHDSVVRWSAKGQRLGTQTFDGAIEDFSEPDWSRELVAVSDRNVLHLLQLERGARARELFSTPLPQRLRLTGVYVAMDSDDTDPRLWRVEPDGLRELERVPVATQDFDPRMFDGLFYPDRTALLRALEAKWPAPRANGERVGYAFAWDVQCVFAVAGAPGSPDGKLYVMRPATKEWKQVSAKIALTPAEIPRESGIFYNLSSSSTTLVPYAGIAVYVERAGERFVRRLYDAKRDVSATLFEYGADDHRNFAMYVRGIAVPRAMNVEIHAGGKPLAAFLWRDGRLEPVPVGRGMDLRAIWPDGTIVHTFGNRVVVVDPKGNARRVQLEK
jgi:hypothetical protein